MHRYLCIFFMIAASCCAQTTTPASQNTAAVSFSAAVLQTSEAQKSLSDLQKKFASREAHLKALSSEVDSLKKELDTTGSKLSDAEKSMRVQSIEMKEKQLRREVEDYQNDSQTESRQDFQAVAAKLYAFLQEYAPQHGYTFVIERGSAENPVLWYAAENADITTPLVQAYNLKSSMTPPLAKPNSSPQKN